ncbi:succinyldiaminopimelate transaminase [Sulfurospirillum oryzae]|uniref:succinyldiaminopimelate transaminase n=1 Tax=Sulfurospirillum oryzae TaxID=2976535 RepID=UPI0021E78549|nr:succinyldiaminopimelate transaminase [Sulfurospirillum oryzae]
MHFEPYPFEKLTELLKDITPNSAYSAVSLTIGEPQFDTPDFIQEAFKKNSYLLNKYPKSSGESYVNEAQRSFVKNRFDVTLKSSELLSTFGTREVLFNFPQYLLYGKPNPVMAYTNPFYQIYEGAAIASRARVVHLNLTKENAFKPDINMPALKEADLIILNFPNNPTTSVLSLDELGEWVKFALKYDIVLLNDECYSEIYVGDKPASLLEASLHVGNPSFKNVLVINSISKRSSAPGLRSGFIAGDEKILSGYAKYRTYVGAGIPLPLQIASAVAWSDMEHVELTRAQYAKNLRLAHEILGVPEVDATFYVWLEVEDDLEFTCKLYEQKNIKVLPGRFLGRSGIGENYVRIALVENSVKTEHILKEIKDFISASKEASFRA